MELRRDKAETFGVISDTHGRLDPRVGQIFAGVAGIFHAGDICGEEILQQLQEIAPVYAVYGNNDKGPVLEQLPRVGIYPFGDRKVLVIHELRKPEAPLPAVRRLIEAEKPDVVIFGHSHRPTNVALSGVLYFNPGSPTVRRQADVPLAVGLLRLAPVVVAEHVTFPLAAH
jgi:putative phosphoesterase